MIFALRHGTPQADRFSPYFGRFSPGGLDLP